MGVLHQKNLKAMIHLFVIGLLAIPLFATAVRYVILKRKKKSEDPENPLFI